MKIGYVQTSPAFGDKQKNFEEVRRLARGVKADLLVLPELFGSGYAFTSREEAEALARVQHTIDEHVKLFARKNPLVVQWHDNPSDPDKLASSDPHR